MSQAPLPPYNEGATVGHLHDWVAHTTMTPVEGVALVRALRTLNGTDANILNNPQTVALWRKMCRDFLDAGTAHEFMYALLPRFPTIRGMDTQYPFALACAFKHAECIQVALSPWDLHHHDPYKSRRILDELSGHSYAPGPLFVHEMFLDNPLLVQQLKHNPGLVFEALNSNYANSQPYRVGELALLKSHGIIGDGFFWSAMKFCNNDGIGIGNASKKALFEVFAEIARGNALTVYQSSGMLIGDFLQAVPIPEEQQKQLIVHASVSSRHLDAGARAAISKLSWSTQERSALLDAVSQCVQGDALITFWNEVFPQHLEQLHGFIAHSGVVVGEHQDLVQHIHNLEQHKVLSGTADAGSALAKRKKL